MTPAEMELLVHKIASDVVDYNLPGRASERLSTAISQAVEAARAEERIKALRDAAKACDLVDLAGADECIEQINILINDCMFPSLKRSRATHEEKQ